MATGDLTISIEVQGTVAGSLTSGTLTAGEALSQAVAAATALLLNNGSTAFNLRDILGTPDNSHTWTGGTSGAVWTPTAAPAVSFSHLKITVEGFPTGATYNFGLGTDNVPSATTPYLTVTSPGYDDTGTLTTTQRIVYLDPDNTTGAIRKPYPNQATADEASVGGNLVTRFALSDAIHPGDTSIKFTAPAGFITSGGTPSNVATSVAVTNHSTIPYPKVTSRWAWQGGDRITGSALTLERVAFQVYGQQKRPVRCVVFTATDGSTTVTKTVTDMAKPTRGDILLGVYECVLDISTLNNGTITANAIAYPWVGDATAVRTTVGGAAQPALTDGPLTFVKGGSESIVYIDPVSGNNATGAVNDSTKPYLSVANALAAIQTANVANSRDGGRVRLRGFCAYGASSVTTTNLWLTFEPDYAAGYTKATAGINSATANTQLPTKLLRFSDLTINPTGSAIRGTTGRYIWLDLCDLSANSTSMIWDYAGLIGTRCNASVGGLNHTTTATYGILHRANVMTGGAHVGPSACSVGNSSSATHVAGLSNGEGGMVLPQLAHQENGVCYGNRRYGHNSSANPAATATYGLTEGFAFVGNLVEVTTGTGPAIACYADGNTTSATNLLFWQNTIAGERCNMGYVAGPLTVLSNWSVRHNSMQWWPSKHDIFNTTGTYIGGWSVMYEQGCRGNNSELIGGTGVNYDLNRKARKSTYATVAGYTSDKSIYGAGGGNGDYAPSSNSALRLKITAGESLIPFDVAGNPFDNTGSGSAGAYQRVADIPAPSSGGIGAVGRRMSIGNRINRLHAMRN